MNILDEIHPEDVIAEAEEAIANTLALATANRTAKAGGRSKGNDGYLTPQNFLAVLSKLGPIALDPSASASPHAGVWATREYRLDRGENGLLLPWKVPLGALTFCNNPYSETRLWIEKADNEHKKHLSEIVLLTAARPDTIATQNAKARAVCFWRGRLAFLDPATGEPPKDAKGKPTGAMFPSMVFYYGLREARFREVFSPFGKVVRW